MVLLFRTNINEASYKCSRNINANVRVFSNLEQDTKDKRTVQYSPMAHVIGGVYIGAKAARADFFLNAKYANKLKGKIRGQDVDETGPKKTDWFQKRPKVKVPIRTNYVQRRQFGWKRIKPEYDIN